MHSWDEEGKEFGKIICQEARKELEGADWNWDEARCLDGKCPLLPSGEKNDHDG